MAVTDIKSLVGKKITKKVKFMDVDVVVQKMTVAEVQQIQAKAQSAEETKDDNAGLSLLQFVIQTAVEGFAELSDDDFRSFPMDELSKLSKACLQFSGLEGEAGK